MTKNNRYPLPKIDELFDQLAGAKIFSQLDLATEFRQLKVVQESKAKTAFRTPDGLYKWEEMPFGLTNALALFVDLMNRVFRGLINKIVVVSVHDILVFSKSAEDVKIT